MSSVFTSNLAAVRTALSEFLDCDPQAFETETLTIVNRREPAMWPYAAFATTFGTGTVLSVDGTLRDFAETLQPEKHYQALGPKVLEALAHESGRRGGSATPTSQGIRWALATVPDAPAVPAQFDLRVLDAEWMEAEMELRRFENGIGLPGEAGRSFRNRYAVALFDRSGEPVAVAGAFFTYAEPIREIGVDVRREHRGKGFANIVVAAAIREILERGEVPFYGCGATNIRSQRTALSNGFLPAFSDASVS
jgi:GNAT superfamily N-acetyltransferase